MARRTLPLIALLVLACGGPAPVPSPSQPSAMEAPSAEPTQPPHAALRDTVAETLDVLPNQLLLVEDGFVTARFREDDDGTLQLVWIGPVGDDLEERLLAEVAEPRSGPTQSTVSVNRCRVLGRLWSRSNTVSVRSGDGSSDPGTWRRPVGRWCRDRWDVRVRHRWRLVRRVGALADQR